MFVGILAGTKNCRACDKCINTHFGHFADVCRTYATIYFQPDITTGGINHLACLARFVQYMRDEFLSAEAGVNGHQQHHIYFAQGIFQCVQWRGRVEYQTGLAAGFPDQGDCAIDMLGSLQLESDVSRARFGKIGNDAIHRLDHQMHVNRRSHAMLAPRFANQRAYGQIWHVMVIHDVKVHDVCTRSQNVIDFFAQFGKIGGENTWGNLIHDVSLKQKLKFETRILSEYFNGWRLAGTSASSDIESKLKPPDIADNRPRFILAC